MEKSMRQADRIAEDEVNWSFSLVVSFQLNRIMYQSAIGNQFGYESGILGLSDIIPDSQKDEQFNKDMEELDYEKRNKEVLTTDYRGSRNTSYDPQIHNTYIRGLLRAIINLADRKGWLYQQSETLEE